MTKRGYSVISHTHWDREWYLPFETFRLKLVDLIDRLFEIFRQYPRYIFHLDCQTVVLEDYLALRPSREDDLKRYIAQGNLVVGPWYLQNDFYLTSGEATIRNLAAGKKLAERFGKCALVGYMPDQFGLVGQLPQILRGFGIDNAVMARGFAKYRLDERGELCREELPTEFIWEGADGSRLLAIYMKSWYNNAQRFPRDPERAELVLRLNDEHLAPYNVSPYLLLMNGVDHLEAQDDLLPILQQLNERRADIRIEQRTLAEHIGLVEGYVAESGAKLTVQRGDLCYGHDYDLLRGCWSTRIRLKQQNVAAQDLLQNVCEPLSAFLEASGCAGYCRTETYDYLWKETMKNHPHDSICGCSRDEVAANMEDRFSRVITAAEELKRRALHTVCDHAALKLRSKENYIVTVGNLTARSASGVVRATIPIPRCENVKNITLCDAEGGEIPFAVTAVRAGIYDTVSGLNLPGAIDTDFWDVAFAAGAVPPMSFRHFAAVPIAGKRAVRRPVKAAPEIENERFRISVTDGKVRMLDKKTGRLTEDFLRWEDCGDRGDSYVFEPAEEPAVSCSAAEEGASATVGALEQTLTVRAALAVPSRYEFRNLRRSPRTTKLRLSVSLRLCAGSGTIELVYEGNNRARDHRVRLLIRCGGAESDVLLTDSAFDCRRHTKAELFPQTRFSGFCNATFAAVERETGGLAVFTSGQHETERVGGYLAVTVLRATGYIARVEGFKPAGGRMWEIPGNQCLGAFCGRLGLYEFDGGETEADLSERAKFFRNGFQVCATSMDERKFIGGRFAVQDSRLAEFYYPADPYAGVTVADGRPAFSCDSPAVAVSAFKKADSGDALAIRAYNLTDSPAPCTVEIAGRIWEAALNEAQGAYLGEDRVRLTFGPKQIKTLLIRMK